MKKRKSETNAYTDSRVLAKGICEKRKLVAWIRKSAGIGLAVFLATVWTGSALAAREEEPIEEIHLNFESEIETGGSSSEVEVTTDDNEYSVEGVEVLNASGDWAGGVRPKLEIYLCAEDGYYFAGTEEDLFHFSGEDAEYVSARKRERSTELYLTVRLEALDREDLDVDEVRWDKENKAATWEENPGVRGYEVRLYRGNTQIASATLRSSSDTSYRFSSQMRQAGTYYFEVRAIGSGSSRGDWEASNKWNLSSSGIDGAGEDDAEADRKELVSPSTSSKPQAGYYSDEEFDPDKEYWDDEDSEEESGQQSRKSTKTAKSGGKTVIATREGELVTNADDCWREDQKGWWFCLEDEGWLSGTWAKIDGAWYCFDEEGYLRYGWIFSGDQWYYCAENGAMLVNARTPDGYFVGGDGAWIR